MDNHRQHAIRSESILDGQRMNCRSKFQCVDIKLYAKFMITCYLLVCERQINRTHLDIPQIPFHSEQHDPAGINSPLSTKKLHSAMSGIYCDFVFGIYVFPHPT